MTEKRPRGLAVDLLPGGPVRSDVKVWSLVTERVVIQGKKPCRKTKSGMRKGDMTCWIWVPVEHPCDVMYSRCDGKSVSWREVRLRGKYLGVETQPTKGIRVQFCEEAICPQSPRANCSGRPQHLPSTQVFQNCPQGSNSRITLSSRIQQKLTY